MANSKTFKELLEDFSDAVSNATNCGDYPLTDRQKKHLQNTSDDLISYVEKLEEALKNIKIEINNFHPED